MAGLVRDAAVAGEVTTETRQVEADANAEADVDVAGAHVEEDAEAEVKAEAEAEADANDVEYKGDDKDLEDKREGAEPTSLDVVFPNGNTCEVALRLCVGSTPIPTTTIGDFNTLYGS